LLSGTYDFHWLQTINSRRGRGKFVLPKELLDFNEKAPALAGAFLVCLFSIPVCHNSYATLMCATGAGFREFGA
jgi:hypothetical protein